MYSVAPHLRLPSPSPSTSLPRVSAALTAPPSSTTNVSTTTPDTSLRSTWLHRAWVAAGSATVLTSLTHTINAAVETSSFTEPIAAALAGYALADLGTGFYHWAIDNYGGASTPIFGSQIDAFQGHHRRPSTITRRGFANNLHGLARAVAFVAAPLDAAAGSNAALHAFVAVSAGCIMFSQQFHAWAHTPRRRLPAAVAALQDAGVLIPTAKHTLHHRPPYNNNYCIVSGAWNGVLDKYRVFEVLEMVIFSKFGVRPRSWSEPGLEWTEEEDDGVVTGVVGGEESL